MKRSPRSRLGQMLQGTLGHAASKYIQYATLDFKVRGKYLSKVSSNRAL
jgi:hypothetical protein